MYGFVVIISGKANADLVVAVATMPCLHHDLDHQCAAIVRIACECNVQSSRCTHMQAMSGLLRAAACCAELLVAAAPLDSPLGGARLFNSRLQPA